jgi:hypothetical protein
MRLHHAFVFVSLVGVTIAGWDALRGEPVTAIGRAAAPEEAQASSAGEPGWKAVPKAECGKGDRVERALQGQTTLAERMTGAARTSFNCNLELVGQFKGEGATWQLAAFDKCAYYGTSNGTDQVNKGVVVIDASDPTHPVAATYLDARAMLDPWESLKVNVTRKLLAAVQADSGNGVEPGFAVYDIADCAKPVLKSSVVLDAPVRGHAGAFAPDGRTYYGTQIRISTYPIDIDDPSAPRLLGVWTPQAGVGVPHDLSLNGEGNRLYTAQPGGLRGGVATSNGLVISDVSAYQERRDNPEPAIVSTLFWKDGSIAQNTERVQIGGRPYIIFTDEAGSGGIGRDRRRGQGGVRAEHAAVRLCADHRHQRRAQSADRLQADARGARAGQLRRGAARHRFCRHLRVLEPLLHGRQRGGYQVRGVQLLRGGAPRVRYSGSAAPARDSLLQAGHRRRGRRAVRVVRPVCEAAGAPCGLDLVERSLEASWRRASPVVHQSRQRLSDREVHQRPGIARQGVHHSAALAARGDLETRVVAARVDPAFRAGRSARGPAARP